MKNLFCRVGGVAVAFAVVAAAPGPALADSAAEASWAKMTRCAAISDDNARHACTDDTLREAGLLESKATAARKSFGLQKPASPLFAPPAPAAARPRQSEGAAPADAASPPAQATAASPASSHSASPAGPAVAPPPKEKSRREQVEVTLARVERGGDGKLMMTTSDGAVWHQVESGALRQLPKRGDTMTIEARSLGGFMCEPSKYVSFRCYRSR